VETRVPRLVLNIGPDCRFNLWSSSLSASCFTTGTGALLFLVLVDCSCPFQMLRETQREPSWKSDQSSPSISPRRSPAKAAMAKAVDAGSGKSDIKELISSKLYAWVSRASFACELTLVPCTGFTPSK
jgi:hypothetical protein